MCVVIDGRGGVVARDGGCCVCFFVCVFHFPFIFFYIFSLSSTFFLHDYIHLLIYLFMYVFIIVFIIPRLRYAEWGCSSRYFLHPCLFVSLGYEAKKKQKYAWWYCQHIHSRIPSGQCLELNEFLGGKNNPSKKKWDEYWQLSEKSRFGLITSHIAASHYVVWNTLPVFVYYFTQTHTDTHSGSKDGTARP